MNERTLGIRNDENSEKKRSPDIHLYIYKMMMMMNGFRFSIYYDKYRVKKYDKTKTIGLIVIIITILSGVYIYKWIIFN